MEREQQLLSISKDDLDTKKEVLKKERYIAEISKSLPYSVEEHTMKANNRATQLQKEVLTYIETLKVNPEFKKTVGKKKKLSDAKKHN